VGSVLLCFCRLTWRNRVAINQVEYRRERDPKPCTKFARSETPGPAVSSGFASDRVPGELVGPYRLIRLLGEGGMAEVWLAQRADGSIKREVALKLPLLRRERQDLSSRFARERDILAALEHPHIARLYDAGVTSDGLPYLAMEYVRGERLTAWCDTRRLGVNERLKLVLQVLDALQYAHAHHVIHRDIKPSNILVNEAGYVRLLDFGVAKLLEQHEQQTDITIVHGRALTPEYASPELARGETVEAASDMYSLGVLLYELLTGCLPYGIKSTNSLALIEQAIVAADVARPSTHLAPEADAARATTQEKLERQLRGDLDAIVLKALAKRPSDRYGSAAALADDLRRYLSGQPVKARPDRFTYRFSKRVQRHRAGWAAGFAATVLAAAALAYALTRPTPLAPIAALSAPSTVSAVTVAAQRDKSIAVLPFVDMSENKDQEYFSDGLSDELINHLSRSPGLKVIARTSSFQFKGKNEDVRSIAGKLGVAHLLEGSVRKAGDELRVTTQLIRASDGVQLWSQTYDRSLADIFKVQDEISERVAKALNATLAISGLPVGQESDVEAYNLVLEGNYYKLRRTKGDVEKAIQLYKKAIDIRPNYALPWARLASGYLTLAEAKGTPSAEDDARIVAALDRALHLDPNLIWAYYTRAGFEGAIKWDWAAAQADHERMRALDPGIYLLPLALGDMALVFGRVDEAVQQYERAIELNPLEPIALRALGVALCATERLQECLQCRLKLQQLHPELRGIDAFVGEARLLLGQLPEALDAMQKEPEQKLKLAGLATVYAAMGRHAESDAAVKTLEESYATDDAYGIAQIHAYRGEPDAAFDWLQRSFRMHDSDIIYAKTDPLLRNLRRDPRFQTLLANLRLPE
jgi:eukaryotic-like serine/threonine-protein kinase